jgi:hypothetical protein
MDQFWGLCSLRLRHQWLKQHSYGLQPRSDRTSSGGLFRDAPVGVVGVIFDALPKTDLTRLRFDRELFLCFAI